jgi:hypothetical protein
MKMKKILLTVLIAISLLPSCKKSSQDSQEQDQEQKQDPIAGNPNPSDAGLTAAFASIQPSQVTTLTTTVRTGGYHVENSLPAGYVKDGSVDYTAQVQIALDQSNSNIIFPPFPIQINDGGILFHSNQKILFETGSELRLKASALGAYKMLYLLSLSNVTLINLVVKGDRDIHTGTGGEGGQGIDIKSCNNVLLIAPKVTNCWGDGFYMSGSNSNITLADANFNNNRRNDISIISVNGLYLIRPYLGFANGTSPQCGLDLEPNSGDNELQNIHLVSPVTEGNLGYGISVGLKQIYVDPDNYPLKNMSITVYDHHDIKSASAVKLSYQKCAYTTETTVQGFVKFTNPVWEKGTGPSLVATICEPATISTLVNPKLIVNGVTLSAADTKSTLLSQVGSGTLNITQ